MKHRSVLAVVVFSIITLGIYDLFWLVDTKKELNAKTSVQVPSLWLPVAPVLALILVAILQTIAGGSGSGSNPGINIISLLLGVVGVIGAIILPFYWLYKYSKAVDEYTKGGVSTAIAFILLWILRFIGMAIIQDKFNEMIASGATAAQAPAGTPMPSFGSTPQPTSTGTPTHHDPTTPQTPTPPPSNPVQ